MYFNYFGGKFCGIDWKNGKTNFNIAADFNINKSNEEKRKHQVAFSRGISTLSLLSNEKENNSTNSIERKENKKKKSKSKQSLKWGRCTMKSSTNTSDLKVQLRNLIEQFDE